MRLATKLSSSLALAAVLGGCASTMYSQMSEPYAMFEAEHRMKVQGVQPALVISVDGKNVPAGRKDPVKPGPRRVEVSITGLPSGNTRTITVDAQPCVRYYLGAKRGPGANDDWVVSVTGTEPIGGLQVTGRPGIAAWGAVVAALSLAAGCAAPTAQEQLEASTGRVTKIVPVYIESDKAPGLGSALAPKTANRPGYRISVITNDQKLIEVTQDLGGFKPGDPVRIQGYGTNAKILPQ